VAFSFFFYFEQIVAVRRQKKIISAQSFCVLNSLTLSCQLLFNWVQSSRKKEEKQQQKR